MRLGEMLKISQGEGPLALRLLALMFVTWSGFAIGGNAVEGLLFTQVGPDSLPYLFVTLGVTTAAVMLGMNALLARPRPHRLLLLALPVMAAAVLGMRGFLALDQIWVYPVAWLAMMVLWTTAGVVTWGIAGAVHDTRQAKRLFPLYSSGVILGGALGGLATGPLARWLGAENLLFAWALALASGFALARSVLRVTRAATSSRSRGRSAVTARSRVAEGLHTVRNSRLLVWMSFSLALFAMLYFSLTLLFARAATQQFRDATSLAGFLGIFMGASSGTALLVSLFAANRLFARLGVVAMVLVLPLIYFGGFAVLVTSVAFLPLLIFRFVQMVWMGGVWAGAWQAMYNVVPTERRDGIRSFIDGVALQGGVVLAGVVLILADRVLEPRVVAVICLVLAGLATATAMRLRKAYAEAVVEALRAGNPDVFVVDEEPFGGFCRDGIALSIVTGATSDPNPSVRRISIEMLAEMRHLNAHSAFIRALADEDPLVRSAGLRGLTGLGSQAWAEEHSEKLVGLLEDGNAAVRLAAVEVVSASNPPGAVTSLSPLLADPDPRVRAIASVRLLASPAETAAKEALASMARSEYAEWRAEAVSAWGGTDEGIFAATSALADSDPLVRRVAVSALAGSGVEAAVMPLVNALREPDPFIRTEAVEGLVRAGQVSVRPLLDAASHPELEGDAMRALAQLDAVDRDVMRDYVGRKVSLASGYSTSLRMVRDEGDPRVELVAHSLRYAARRHAVDVLQVSSRGWDVQAADAVVLAIENLEASDPAQRANALETLEAVGEPKVIRPLLSVWEEPAPRPGDLITVLAGLMADPDPWVRACAAFAGRRHQQLKRHTADLAAADPDKLVREAAGADLLGEGSVETLPSLSLMERIVFLRRVPLFVNLSPPDLRHVANAASEHVFSDGALIAGQGEPGDEMHIIASGCIRVLVARGDERIEVARRAAGECVGEMAVVSRASRMASLVAEGEVRTLAIDRRRFERILRDRPEVSLAVMGVLSDRLRELHGAEPPEVRS